MNSRVKKVIYISNVEVPYRIEFFNQLAKQCDLTVLYEKDDSNERNKKWMQSVKKNYRVEYLNGKRVVGDNYFSFKILKYIFSKPDVIVIGCYNSPVQMFATILMRIFRVKYIINLDGEPYLDGNPLKVMMKKFFLNGATHYLVAGNIAAKKLGKIINENRITMYPFSSLTRTEINSNICDCNDKRESVLVVGQYYEYKGLDIAARAARMLPNVKWKFVGMGKRKDAFIKEQNIADCSNIEVIPFLQKENLYEEYRKCKVLVLPSRQECWGLVVNEAASIGTPIVSTWGSGAAVEFLKDSEYERFLANSGNADDLAKKVQLCLERNNTEYCKYLLKKSKQYTIESCVQKHIEAFNSVCT